MLCRVKSPQHYNSIILLIFILLTRSFSTQAQDTLRVNLRQADSIFQSNSYYLLAAQMNIEAQKAQVLQSKLYPNPVFTGEIDLYDHDNKKYFNIGTDGEKSFQIDQLILLGGKRKSEIDMAKTNVTIAELEFTQLIRQLKYTMHTELFSVAQYQHSINAYRTQLQLLDSIINAYDAQAAKGNLPLKDVVRLKGTYMTLNNALSEMLHDYHESMTKLQTLLQTNKSIVFVFSPEDINKYIKVISMEDVKNSAYQNNPELLILQQNKILATQYLSYQKRLTIPDVNLFGGYDQRGAAFYHQFSSGVNIPLPLWNRNQGNIKTAQFQLKSTDYSLKAFETEINNKISNQYQLYNQGVSQYLKANSMYNADFEITMKGMSDNFQKRNVTLIEFVDFFEAYSSVLSELARINIQLVSTAEELSNLAGKDLY